MKAYLALEDGSVFEGNSVGAKGTAFGEIVFNTSMTGYQEMFTDPSNFGHIINMTYPLIGNYGVNEEDNESSKVWASGLVAREICKTPSNWRITQTLTEFLIKNNVVAIEGVDTREITDVIREKGSMGAVITTDKDFKIENYIDKIKSYMTKDAVSDVTCKEKYTIENKNAKYKVAVFDLGLRRSMLKRLVDAGCTVTVFPATTSADEIIAGGFDGLVISNGPHNSNDYAKITENLKSIQQTKLPILGIGLGHNLLALANGLKIEKMKHGHRGANYPVVDIKRQRTYITSQNHGFVVSLEQADAESFEITHKNLNDNTIEGICYKNYPVFSVQFEPGSSEEPFDSGYLFSDFKACMEVRKNA